MAERAEYLVSKGFSVQVICPKVTGVTLNKYSHNGVEVSRIGFSISYTGNKVRGLAKRVFKGYSIWSLYAVCFYVVKGLHSDAVYTVNHPIALHFIGFLIAKFKKTKWLAEQRDPIVGYEYSKKVFLHEFLSKNIRGLIEKNAVTFGRKSVVTEASPKNTVIAPDYGVDVGSFPIISEKIESNNGSSLKGIYAGGLYAFHGRALEKFSELLSKNSIEVDYFGHDEFQQMPAINKKGAVQYSWLVSNYRKYSFVVAFEDYSAFKSGFLPSKVCELIATQLPILVVRKEVNCGDLSNLVEKNEIGVSIQVDDGEAYDQVERFVEEFLVGDKFNFGYYPTVKDSISLKKDLEFFYGLL